MFSISARLQFGRPSLFRFFFRAGPVRSGKVQRLEMILKDGQEVDIRIRARDREGNLTDVQFEGVPLVQSSDDTLVEAFPQSTNTSVITARTVAGPGLGQATVSVEGDTDLGEGVQRLRGELDITVVANDTVALVLEAGEPRDRADTGAGDSGSAPQ